MDDITRITWYIRLNHLIEGGFILKDLKTDYLRGTKKDISLENISISKCCLHEHQMT